MMRDTNPNNEALSNGHCKSSDAVDTTMTLNTRVNILRSESIPSNYVGSGDSTNQGRRCGQVNQLIPVLRKSQSLRNDKVR